MLGSVKKYEAKIISAEGIDVTSFSISNRKNAVFRDHDLLLEFAISKD